MNNQKQIVSAIIVVGIIIAGTILLKGSTPSTTKNSTEKGIPVTTATLAPVGKEDRVLGSQNAKVSVIIYADFQCPFCGAITGLQGEDAPAVKYLKQKDPSWTPSTSGIVNDYVKNGDVQFVYRDFAILGAESERAAEAARCAGDQEKFWDYHDYLFIHQNGENKGAFSDDNLKSFAKEIGLNVVSFDKCLDDSKYAQAVANSRNEGITAGVTGTPKGFIVKNNAIVGIIDGAESYVTVKPKIDSALK
ncbi:MAG: thioredoxin domain-containing protein [Candidatus Paceibacterota bacterium]|jgi:protein-disulfide isomerase